MCRDYRVNVNSCCPATEFILPYVVFVHTNDNTSLSSMISIKEISTPSLRWIVDPNSSVKFQLPFAGQTAPPLTVVYPLLVNVTLSPEYIEVRSTPPTLTD